ncbi:ASCH domain-containing protein [Microvirga lotononidis]|uniref:ASCH domain-containing protein n=1 Tax=Microvirga lotononidis TaxID=864069 RepID=UPI0012B5786F|nr:ASCH domain-containing protein [Microvirga lotononidis]
MAGPVPNPKEAIISIHPRFAEAILAGSKKVELRRRIPNLEAGTLLWIYATVPVKAVVGSAIIASIIRDTPEEIWNTYSQHSAIDRDEFDRYFEGTTEAVCIKLRAVKRVRHVGIERLRKWKVGFHPPQVISKIANSDAIRLRKLIQPLGLK